MYGQEILGIDIKYSREMKDALMNGNELIRIGFSRINFNYFISEEEIDYQLKAIEFVSNFGWMFLPHYKFDIDTGLWINRDSMSRTRDPGSGKSTTAPAKWTSTVHPLP